jgi:hypothetical protein
MEFKYVPEPYFSEIINYVRQRKEHIQLYSNHAEVNPTPFVLQATHATGWAGHAGMQSQRLTHFEIIASGCLVRGLLPLSACTLIVSHVCQPLT